MAEVANGELMGEENDALQLNKYLTFILGSESYGLGIRYVREIIGMQKITMIPDVPNYIRGVINLRGKVIPVMDVRARLHFPYREYDDRTCIIVIDVSDWLVGLVVDTVSEVLDIPPESIEPPPRAFGSQPAHFVAGMGRVGEQVRLLIDANKLLGRSDGAFSLGAA